jgi:hypothetical protein
MPKSEGAAARFVNTIKRLELYKESIFDFVNPGVEPGFFMCVRHRYKL